MTAQAGKPTAWRLYLSVLAPSLLVVCVVAALAIINVSVLGALRAYAGGESLWSKARSNAVQYVTDYAWTADPADYARYEESLTILLAARRAREEMLRDTPDMAVIRDGLIPGGNHPDDIASMVTLFRRLGKLPVFHKALVQWGQADALVEQLQTVARALKTQRDANANPAQIRATVEQIRRVNDELNNVGIRFIARTGEASRLTQEVLLGSLLLAAILLSLGSVAIVHRALNRQGVYQQSLATANERWQLATTAAEMGLFEMAIPSGLIRLDAKAAALYGLAPQAIALTPEEMSDLIAEADRERLNLAVQDALQSGQVFKLAYQAQLRDGTTRSMEATGRTVHDRPATPSRLVGMVRDVTDERAQAQLTAQRDAAEKVAREQRGFLSRLSHELRTPLNAIMGFSQLLALDAAQSLTPAQQQQIKWILSAGQQLLTLVEDVLDITKVEAGEITMSLQNVELQGILNACLPLVDSVRQQFRVEIINRLPDQPLLVHADPQRLQQVFINLLSNGCKYNRPGGHVVIETNTDATGEVTIEFSDNGIGLTESEAAQLFQPFKRVGSSAARIEGTGLGLFIVKQLVERMGGSVTLNSQKDVGSRFTLRLPAGTPGTLQGESSQIAVG
ncbi:MAG: PAS domain-containing protein [Burkholderiales bacterium]|nr:PAS domain-containing protein [Burkholderiales bacterium]